jgi:hypothetical protein
VQKAEHPSKIDPGVAAQGWHSLSIPCHRDGSREPTHINTAFQYWKAGTQMPIHRRARAQDNNRNKAHKPQTTADPKSPLRKISEQPHQSPYNNLTTWEVHMRHAHEPFWF